jgi:23S rRNA pseudouridine2605 synthase
VRLAKYLAHSGVASRRAAEKLIAGGRVTVRGEVVDDPAHDVDDASDVRFDGERVGPEPRELYALNKPVGVVSTARDPGGNRTVVDLVPSERRLYPVGRLDQDSSGLILLTNDGDLANLLMHPRYGVEKTYRVTVARRTIRDEELQRLREGVELDDGPTRPAKVRRLGAREFEITIGEGRNRQVRRMVEAVEHRVAALERTAFGPLRLGGLAPGEHRRLGEAEVERLRRIARP